MTYTIKLSTKFRKDLKLVNKRGYNIALLTDIIKELVAGKKLSKKNKDHVLIGNFVGYRECHITTDWLLIYEIDNTSSILYLTRTGTHSDLF